MVRSAQKKNQQEKIQRENELEGERRERLEKERVKLEIEGHQRDWERGEKERLEREAIEKSRLEQETFARERERAQELERADEQERVRVRRRNQVRERSERALMKTTMRAASEAKRSELAATSVCVDGSLLAHSFVASLASLDEDENTRDEFREMATDSCIHTELTLFLSIILTRSAQMKLEELERERVERVKRGAKALVEKFDSILKSNAFKKWREVSELQRVEMLRKER